MSQMPKHLTIPEMSKAFLHKILDLPQEGQLKRIRESLQDVFKGIGKHKFCQIQLLINNDVKPIIQSQHRIPFAKMKKLDKILDKLEESGVNEQVEGATDWLSNLVVTHKTDPILVAKCTTLNVICCGILRQRQTCLYIRNDK